MIRETIQQDGLTIHTRQLDSTLEAVDLAKQIAHGSAGDRARCASVTGDEDFTRTTSLDQAIQLFEYGWDEGRERVEAALTEVSLDDVTAQLRQTVQIAYDVSGDEPDVDRYLSGDPESMMEFPSDEARHGRIIDLKVSVGQHAFVSEEAILRRGVIVVAAAGMVAAAGYGLRIEATEHLSPSGWFGSGSSRLEYAMPISQAGDYFNVDTVAFALAHPSFLRRILFAVEETEEASLREEFGIYDGRGYGRPEYIRRAEGDISVHIDKDDYLDGAASDIPNDAQDLAQRLIASVEQQTEA